MNISSGDIVRVDEVAPDDWDKWLKGATVRVTKSTEVKLANGSIPISGFSAIIKELADADAPRDVGDSCYVMSGGKVTVIQKGLFPWEEGYDE